MGTQSGKMEVLRPLGLHTERRILVYNQRTGGSMRVGDLVRHKSEHEHMGIIVELGYRDMLVAWNDGDISWCYQVQMEAL